MRLVFLIHDFRLTLDDYLAKQSFVGQVWAIPWAVFHAPAPHREFSIPAVPL